MPEDEIIKLRDFVIKNNILKELSNEFFYCHPSLCILDAVYSANAVYSSVKNAIKKYVCWYKLSPIFDREQRKSIKEDTIEDLRAHIKEHGPAYFAQKVLDNNSKIRDKLKSEIVLELCEYFLQKNIITLEDLCKWGMNIDPDKFKVENNIYGIGPTIVRYLTMLAGNESRVKPDRHILNFLFTILSRPVNDLKEAELILQSVAKLLNTSPRTLDNSIWRYQANKKPYG